MSHFLDRLTFFNRVVDEFSDGHGITTNEDRRWEDGYRKRWQHDKIVRSTHGVNCTGSCSWKIYVKGGIVTWETQQTDYPRTRPDLPNHEPRGCSRGASYSWYLYSGNRVKYPLVRSRLLKLWREARALRTPVAAWKSIVEDPEKRAAYVEQARPRRLRARDLGRGQRDHRRGQRLHGENLRARSRVRLLADPGDVDGELRRRLALSVAARRRLHVVLRLVLRPAAVLVRRPGASRPTFRKAPIGTIRASCILWGSNVPQTRTPDAHFYTEARYHGAKSVVICPDYSEASKFADLWMSPKQGTDAALAMAMGHVILREFHIDRQAKYFEDYVRQYTDMPMLVRLVKQGDALRAGALPARLRFRRQSAARPTIRNGRRSPIDETSKRDRRAERLGRLPLGREGQVESGGKGLERAATPSCGCRFADDQGRRRRGRLPLFRQSRARPFPRHRPSRACSSATCRRRSCN